MQPEPTPQPLEPAGSVWASRRAPEEGWVNGVFILMPDFVDALRRDIQAALSNSVSLVGEEASDIPDSAGCTTTSAMSFKWSPSTLSLLRRTVEAYNTGARPVTDS